MVVGLRGGLLFGDAFPRPVEAEPRPLVEAPVGLPLVLEHADALLAHWRTRPAEALATGGLGVRQVREAGKALGLHSAEVGLLTHLTADVGLLGVAETGSSGRGRNRKVQRRWAPTALLDEWAAQRPADQWAHLVAAWRGSMRLWELDGLPERMENDRIVTSPRALAVRSAWLLLLRGLPAGTGLDEAALQQVAAARFPMLLGHGETEPLLTASRLLGLVPDHGPVGLTTAARALLDGPDALEALLPPPATEVIVQADLTVTAPPGAAPEVTRALARWADLESAAGARVYRIDERRLAAALDDGDDADGILRWLDEHSRVGVPQNVDYLVRDVARRRGQVRGGSTASYLRCDDPALLTSALAVKAAKLRLLAPTVAVSPLPLQKLLAALADKGVAAVAEDESGAEVRRTTPGVRRVDWHRGRSGLPALPRVSSPEGAAAALLDRTTPREIDEVDDVIERLQLRSLQYEVGWACRRRGRRVVTEYDNPLIVQSDATVLLEVAAPKAGDARAALARFAELEKSPEHLHTYRITPLSLWNAASAGLPPDAVTATLTDYAKYPVPDSVLVEVRDQMARFGRLRIVRDFDAGALALTTGEPALLEEIARDRQVATLLGERLDGNRFRRPARGARGAEAGAAAPRLAGRRRRRLHRGHAARSATAGGAAPVPVRGRRGVVGRRVGRRRQRRARPALRGRQDRHRARRDGAGGLLGARGRHLDPRGPTVDRRDHGEDRPRPLPGRGVLRGAQAAAPGHRRHLPGAHLAGPDRRRGRPARRGAPSPRVFDAQAWGLVVYDEVHLLPAPVFRATAQIQAVRRLGLTATLVREDGREPDVFALIGPKRYDAPWRDLEAQGWIAPASCTEVRVALDDAERMTYATAPERQRYRIAATTTAKHPVLDALLARHREDRVLVIGQYLEQLQAIADRFDAPIVTGKTSQAVREERFAAFRDGDLRLLVVSKVANFSIDLPEANVAVQVSGAFGSRQEEAQRLGRIVRPKADGGQASFYTVVARETVDQAFAAKRQRFLTEQGYAYTILDAEAVGV